MTAKPADIYSRFEHIRERMEQAYRQVIGPPGSPRFCAPYMEPAVDVYETCDDIVVIVEIAGIQGEEVEVEVDGRVLFLKGERRPLPGRPGRIYSQMEIAHGGFQRELTLPAEVDAAAASAQYKDGILEVVLPKAAANPGRQLKIVAR